MIESRPKFLAVYTCVFCHIRMMYQLALPASCSLVPVADSLDHFPTTAVTVVVSYPYFYLWDETPLYMKVRLQSLYCSSFRSSSDPLGIALYNGSSIVCLTCGRLLLKLVRGSLDKISIQNDTLYMEISMGAR